MPMSLISVEGFAAESVEIILPSCRNWLWTQNRLHVSIQITDGVIPGLFTEFYLPFLESAIRRCHHSWSHNCCRACHWSFDRRWRGFWRRFQEQQRIIDRINKSINASSPTSRPKDSVIIAVSNRIHRRRTRLPIPPYEAEINEIDR